MSWKIRLQEALDMDGFWEGYLVDPVTRDVEYVAGGCNHERVLMEAEHERDKRVADVPQKEGAR